MRKSSVFLLLLIAALIAAQFLTSARNLTRAETYRFQLNWRRETGEWKIDYVRLLEIMEK